MAFTIAGMLLGSKARTILNLIRLALRTTFPSVLICGHYAFVLMSVRAVSAVKSMKARTLGERKRFDA